MKRPKNVKGKMWIGVWSNGQLGWGVPNWLSPGRSASRLEQEQAEWFWENKNEVKNGVRAGVYLCEVSVKLLLDKNKKPIRRNNLKRITPAH